MTRKDLPCSKRSVHKCIGKGKWVFPIVQEALRGLMAGNVNRGCRQLCGWQYLLRSLANTRFTMSIQTLRLLLGDLHEDWLEQFGEVLRGWLGDRVTGRLNLLWLTIFFGGRNLQWWCSSLLSYQNPCVPCQPVSYKHHIGDTVLPIFATKDLLNN